MSDHKRRVNKTKNLKQTALENLAEEMINLADIKKKIDANAKAGLEFALFIQQYPVKIRTTDRAVEITDWLTKEGYTYSWNKRTMAGDDKKNPHGVEFNYDELKVSW
jgi:hypothetical protein